MRLGVHRRPRGCGRSSGASAGASACASGRGPVPSAGVVITAPGLLAGTAPVQLGRSGWTGRRGPGTMWPVTPAPTLLDDLAARGLIHDTTDPAALAARLAEGPVALYYGCDPTADSLHIGNLIGLLVLRRFQDAGHRAMALAGGA